MAALCRPAVFKSEGPSDVRFDELVGVEAPLQLRRVLQLVEVVHEEVGAPPPL